MGIPAEKVREYLDYIPETGRLIRVKRRTSGKLGVPIGRVNIGSSGGEYRRAYFKNRAFQTAHLVWAWHHGAWPESTLVRKNGDTLDDRIENLVQSKDLRRPVSVAPLLSPEDQPETMLGDLPENLNTGIYEILNVKNGRRYIGSAVNVSKRWREHLRQLEDGKHHSRFMQRCWNKNGSDCFVFRVVLSCEKENLLMYEQAFLDFHEPEYNSAKVAGSQLGFRHSEESRAKMSASRPKGFSPMRGKTHSDATKLKISQNRKGKGGTGWTEERKRKISEALKGREISPEHREKLRAANLGKKQSAETIEKRTAKLRGRKMPEDARKAASERMKGTKMSDAAKLKMRKSKSRLADDQVKEIKSMIKEKRLSQKKIAEKYSVDQSVISEINTGKAYSWVD